MGKTILAEEHISEYLGSFVKKKTCVVGLIVGKSTKLKDYVIKLISCPQKEDSSTTDFQIDPAWVAGTAAEIANLLPGGFSVNGVFVVSPKDVSNNVQASLRQALYATYKLLSKSSLVKSNEEQITWWSLLHVDLNTGRTLFCKQYDMTDNASAGKPADWKFNAFLTRWSILTATLKVEAKLYVNDISNNLEHQLKTCIASSCKSLSTAVTTVDGEVQDFSKILDAEPSASSTTKGRKNKPTLSKWGRTLKCQFYLQQNETLSPVTEIKSAPCTHVISLNGSIFACAYLPSKATVEEGIQELKLDAVRSLNHRCTLVAEDIVERKVEIEADLSITLPKRVAFTFSGKREDFFYFDYCFREETLDDSISRIQETFDITVNPDSIIDDLETYPADIVKSPIKAPDKIADEENIKLDSSKPKTISKAYITLGVILAAGAALLSTAFSYLSLSE